MVGFVPLVEFCGEGRVISGGFVDGVGVKVSVGDGSVSRGKIVGPAAAAGSGS